LIYLKALKCNGDLHEIKVRKLFRISFLLAVVLFVSGCAASSFNNFVMRNKDKLMNGDKLPQGSKYLKVILFEGVQISRIEIKYNQNKESI